MTPDPQPPLRIADGGATPPAISELLPLLAALAGQAEPLRIDVARPGVLVRLGVLLTPPAMPSAAREGSGPHARGCGRVEKAVLATLQTARAPLSPKALARSAAVKYNSYLYGLLNRLTAKKAVVPTTSDEYWLASRPLPAGYQAVGSAET